MSEFRKRTYLTQLHMEGSVSRLEELDTGEQSYFMGSLARLGGCAGQGTAHLSPQVAFLVSWGFLVRPFSMRPYSRLSVARPSRVGMGWENTGRNKPFPPQQPLWAAESSAVCTGS